MDQQQTNEPEPLSLNSDETRSDIERQQHLPPKEGDAEFITVAGFLTRIIGLRPPDTSGLRGI